MWLSMLSLLASLLTLVASQSCPDPSENSASWVRLKPLGQCKDGESTCPYRITLPPLTVQLPKPFRELEKMARELQSLTQMVNQLKEDCRECKEKKGMDWNIRTNNEGKDGERIQASRGTLNTRERQQDVAKKERTVQVTTSGAVVEDTTIISSDAKDANPTPFGKQRNTNQKWNVNPRTTKTRSETNGGPKNPMSKIEEVPSPTTTKKKILQSPMTTLTESSLVTGDLDNEQPTEQEKQVRHEIHPSGSQTAKGKVKSIPKYHPLSIIIEDDDGDIEYNDGDYDYETKQLHTTKGDKEPGERHLVTATDAPNYRELQPNIKQLARKQQEKMDEKEVADTGLKESKSNIFDDTNNGNDGKERSVSVIQQPTLKSKEKNTHSASTTKLKPLKPGAYSERDTERNSRPVNTDDTIKGQKKVSSPITGRANASVTVSQNKFKNAFKPDTDAKMDKKSKPNTAETVSGEDTSASPISGITYSIVDVSPTKPQTLGSKKQLHTGKDSESDAGINSNPVYNVDRFSNVKNSRSPSSERANATINAKIQKSNFQTPFKPGTDTERKASIDSNPFNRIKNSRLPISDITYTVVDVRPTNPQILNSNDQFDVGTDSESDGGIYSNTVNNTETVSDLKNSAVPISDKVNATDDVINPRRQSINSQTSLKSNNNAESNTEMDLNPIKKIVSVGGQETSWLPISGITDDLVDVSVKNPQILDSKNQFRTDTDSDSGSVINSNTEDSGQEMSTSTVTGITDGIVDIRSTNLDLNKFRTGTNSENDGVRDSNPVNNVDTVGGLKNSKSSTSDRASSIADVDLINTQSLDPQNPFTHEIDVKNNSRINSHRFNTSEKVRRMQTSKSPTSDIINAVNQTYPGTLNERPFKTVADRERKAEMDLNPLNKVETNNAQLSITSKADATVNVNRKNPQMVYSNSENATVVSSPVNKVETDSRLVTPRSPISGRSDQINPKAIDHISKNPLKPGTVSERKTGMHPNRDHTNDIVSQRGTSETPISNSRPDISGTNPSLNSNGDLPKRQFLPKSKLNMTQPRNGQISGPNPMSIDAERKKTQRNNKTTSLRGDAIKSGRQMPSGRLPVKPVKHQEIPKRPERISPTGISLSTDPRRRKPYILQRKPVNESKAFGSGGPKNTSGVTHYTKSNGTIHVDSRTISSANCKLNSTACDKSQPIRPTLATKRIVDEALVKTAKTAHTVEVLHTMVDHQIESTSQPTVTKQGHGNSGQDLVLESVNNIGRDSKPPVVKETKGADRRPGQTAFKTSTASSNQENHRNPFRGGNSKQNLGGKMPLGGVSRERNRLNYPTTAATPYTTKTDFKDKHSKMPQFTPPVITPPHFMDQDHEEQAKTTSGVKASNKHVHHRLNNPSQEIESKRSHSDTTNKEMQSAGNGQGSSGVTDFQLNSLNRTQNRATGSTGSLMDIVKASMGSKVSSRSTESPNEEKARGISLGTGQGMNKVEASTEANPSSDNAPVKYNRYTKSPLGSTDSVGGNNERHSIENNNGNSYPVAVNRMTGETLHKIPAGHTSSEDDKKVLTVNNMDDRQGLEKQLLSNCQGQCNSSSAPPSILNSRESSDNSRDKPPQDCSDFVIRNPTSGIYNVTPTGSGNRTFPVYCDMKSSGGGWTLIQNRFSGRINFNRTWNDYKRGFGNLTGEFWLGNDKMHWLTSSKPMVLRIELEDLDGIKEYAQYDTFHVANESQYYRLTIEEYSGTAGDAMQYSKKFNHNQKNFTTPDRDNDQYTSGNCGAYYSSGWWFDACMAANLNGKYYETRYKGVRNGIFWGTWHNISSESYLTNERQSFKTVRMMIRPRTGLLMD